MPVPHLHDPRALPVNGFEPTLLRRARRLLHRSQAVAAARVHWLSGRRAGLAYRLAGRHPDADVPDRVIAERVRAILGVELKRMKVHDVHVESVDRVVYLRGAVQLGEAGSIERLVLGVPGVLGVESYLELLPSSGTLTHVPHSPALERMLVAAREEGCHPPDDRTAVLGALATFSARIPLAELRHVWVHLPTDLRGVLRPPVRLGATPHRIRQPENLYRAVAAASGVDVEVAQRLTGKLLAELHSLVPEEAADVEAVLPTPLKKVWHLAGAV